MYIVPLIKTFVFIVLKNSFEPLRWTTVLVEVLSEVLGAEVIQRIFDMEEVQDV